jgi:hypothetical protein
MDKKIFQNTILEKQYQPAKWKEVLKDYFGVKKLHQQPQPIILPANDIAENAVELGSFYTADDRLVGIYEITINTDATTKIDINRVGLRSLLRNIYKYDVDAALIVFVHGTKWRFSYVSEIRTEEGKKETEPKRYTYLFGEGESCRTAADRFDKLKGKQIYLNDLFEAFSVEKLNKDFFKTYKEFHERFWKFLADDEKYYRLLCDNRQEDKVKQEKPIRDFAKKLLGRIVFLQFLQKKGWMGVSANTPEWTGGNSKFLQSLFAKSNNKNKFHSTELKDLFFKTLNSKRTNDIAPESLGKDIKIPYLNGGLFDKDISFENSIDFPEKYFAQLLDFFEQYNFTIDENDPYDSEVGIDPEMLGHIFENLLEENREKGAFYTPKEIVHYMCQESLIQYLRTHLPECTEDDSPATKALENFIRNGIIGDRHDKKNFVVQQAKRIEKLLDKVKICDPAIGSGAFPMGMLQEIFKAKTSLDLTLDHADVKRQIIQNNIYGVDIEPGAVDIARLRFWLALVVDETEPQPLPNLDYKIMQGNSLLEQFEDISLKFEKKVFEVKVVKEVDLFGRPINPQYTINEYLQTKQSAKEFDITELEEKYFNSNNADEKQQIRDKIENFERQFILEQLNEREKILKDLLQHKENDLNTDISKVSEANAVYLRKGKSAKDIEKQKTELEKVRQYRKRLNEIKPGEKPWFLWHLYFMDVFDPSTGSGGGFDIVIGNPPFVDIKKLDRKTVKILFNNFKTTTNRANLYAAFIEFSYSLINKKGVLTFIVPNSLLINESYIKVRDLLVNELSTIVKTPDSIFENAIVETIIFLLNKGLKSDNIKGKQFSHDEHVNFEEINYQLYKRNTWLSDANKRFSIFGNQTILNLLDKIENSNICFEDEFDFSLGITPYDKYKGHTQEMIENRVFHSDTKKDKTYVPLIAGDNFSKYIIKGSKKEYLKYGEWLGAPREKRFFIEPKVIVRQILAGNSLEITAAYSEEDTYFTQIGFSIIKNSDEGRSTKFLVAILNSKIITFYHKYKFLDIEKITFPKILIANCKRFSLPNNNPKKEDLIEKVVSKIKKIKEDKLDSSKYENKIDALVFHLYNLTESEMLLVLDSYKDLSIKDRNQIQNEYWNIANNKFQLEI